MTIRPKELIAYLVITWVFVIGACIAIAETWFAEERVQSRHQNERQHRAQPTADRQTKPTLRTILAGQAPVSLTCPAGHPCIHSEVKRLRPVATSPPEVASYPHCDGCMGGLRGVRHARSPKTQRSLLGSQLESGGRFLPLARAAARLCGLEGKDEQAFYALIERESGWDPHATSASGAYGLGQLFERTARAVSPPPPGSKNSSLSIYDPAQNLIVAACYLRQQIDRFGLRRGLHAYHDGPGAISRGPATQQARRYASDIIGTSE